jgi:hypothetical protein
VTGRWPLAAIAGALLCVACANYGSAPSVTALPGSDKTTGQFDADDAECRALASERTGRAPGSIASDIATMSLAIGTAVGAAAGAGIGAAAGDPLVGLAIGAGSGLIVGSIIGAERALSAGRQAQRTYDATYVQCMYDQGHRVPAPRGSRPEPERPPQPTRHLPLPPPGPPPPPPPDVE